MAAMACNANAAQIDPSQSLVGANAHPLFNGPNRVCFCLASKWHLDRFIRFCKAHGRDSVTNTQTNHTTPPAAVNRISAMRAIIAMPPQVKLKSVSQSCY